MSNLLAARAQSGTSLVFHIVFSILGVGLRRLNGETPADAPVLVALPPSPLASAARIWHSDVV